MHMCAHGSSSRGSSSMLLRSWPPATCASTPPALPAQRTPLLGNALQRVALAQRVRAHGALERARDHQAASPGGSGGHAASSPAARASQRMHGGVRAVCCPLQDKQISTAVFAAQLTCVASLLQERLSLCRTSAISYLFTGRPLQWQWAIPTARTHARPSLITLPQHSSPSCPHAVRCAPRAWRPLPRP